jgi:hypothetical protein
MCRCAQKRVIDASAGNTVGASVSGGRNVISGNGISGVYVKGPKASGNLVEGNYLGAVYQV